MAGLLLCMLFFFNQKTAYEMRISDWSSDVCSSDLMTQRAAKPLDRAAQRVLIFDGNLRRHGKHLEQPELLHEQGGKPVGPVVEVARDQQIGRASCRERVCQYV